MGDDKRLDAMPWDGTALEVAHGRSEGFDLNAVSHAFGGVAETGTPRDGVGARQSLDPQLPPRQSHRRRATAKEVACDYESVWAKVRFAFGMSAMPRTVNWITGPSRSGDIEQTMLLGAHGRGGCMSWSCGGIGRQWPAVRWSAWEGCEAGIEHCEVRPEGGRILIEGLVIGSNEGAPFGLDYRLVLDRAWLLREAELRTAAGRSLRIERRPRLLDRRRPWNPLFPAASTSTSRRRPHEHLPIRRLDLGRTIRRHSGRLCPRAFATPSHQGASATPPSKPGRPIASTASTSRSTADLPIDRDGLVLDYPGLFRRLV